MNILGFIPARKGSQGIRGKNLKKLNGKPLIYYTLKTLSKLKTNSNIFSFISTNDQKLKRYCESQGFKINYSRPHKLSSSKSNIVDTALHGLKWFENFKNIKIDAILLLQPTSPIRKVNEIIMAINHFKKKKLQSLASVSPVKEHPYEIIEENKKKKWKFLKKSKKNIYRRQEFDNNFYFVDGNFYIVTSNFLRTKKTFIKENYTKIFKLKRNWPVDIDNIEDFQVASSLLKSKK